MATYAGTKKLRNARVEGRQQQWFARKRRGVANGWVKAAVKYNAPDKNFAKTPAAEQRWWESGPNVGPIVTDLNAAKTAAALHTALGRTNGTTSFNAAKTKINALASEFITAAIAACDAGIANLVLATNAGDDAAIVNANTAITEVNKF